MTASTVDLDPVSATYAERGVEEPAPRPGVVHRMTQILDVFVSDSEYQRLDDVTVATGMPRSTTFRLLSQLVELDWLEHNEHGFRLGGRTLGMAARVEEHHRLRSAAADILNELHLKTGAVAHLGVLVGSTVTYLDKVGGRAGVSFPTRVGDRKPAHSTALGRALLAGLPPKHVESLLSSDGPKGHPPSDLPALHAQLRTIRQRHGVSIHTPRSGGPEITSIAAPIVGPDGAIGGIALAARTGRRIDSLAPIVSSAARQTSQALFPGWVQARPLRGRYPSIRRTPTRWRTRATRPE